MFKLATITCLLLTNCYLSIGNKITTPDLATLIRYVNQQSIHANLMIASGLKHLQQPTVNDTIDVMESAFSTICDGFRLQESQLEHFISLLSILKSSPDFQSIPKATIESIQTEADATANVLSKVLKWFNSSADEFLTLAKSFVYEPNGYILVRQSALIQVITNETEIRNIFINLQRLTLTLQIQLQQASNDLAIENPEGSAIFNLMAEMFTGCSILYNKFAQSFGTLIDELSLFRLDHPDAEGFLPINSKVVNKIDECLNQRNIEALMNKVHRLKNIATLLNNIVNA